MKEIRLGLLGLDYDTEAGRGWPGARYGGRKRDFCDFSRKITE